MAWTDRIRTAAYTAPSGTRIEFDYEDVSRSVDKKTTSFSFPDADGTYVQDLGRTGRRYPLRVFLWGADYDLIAANFESLLIERGIGKLEHPIYGVVDVVPFGSIARRDDLKTAANQSVIEVTFFETIRLIYPTGIDDPASNIIASVSTFNDAAADQLQDELEVSTVSERIGIKGTYQAAVNAVQSGLDTIANEQDSVRRQFESIVSSINNGIDALIADPLSLAYQTSILIQAPARAAAAISDRLSAYANLANSIITGDNSVAVPSYDNRESNRYHTLDLFAMSYVTGSVLSVVNNQFDTKTEALAAAEAILTQLDDVTIWRDANYEALAQVDTGGAYQQLQSAVALTAGFLVEISFTLKQERRLVLDRARTIIDLVAELYGSIDDQLDFFIASNDLTGSEILELPRGREVVYYV